MSMAIHPPTKTWIAALNRAAQPSFATKAVLHQATSNRQIIIPNVDDARHDLTATTEIITFSTASD
jgi:hypothetical protein